MTAQELQTIAEARELMANKNRKGIDLALRKFTIALRAVYESAHHGNVRCQEAVKAMEAEK